jgi:hypothetical protein
MLVVVISSRRFIEVCMLALPKGALELDFMPFFEPESLLSFDILDRRLMLEFSFGDTPFLIMPNSLIFSFLFLTAVMELGPLM